MTPPPDALNELRSKWTPTEWESFRAEADVRRAEYLGRIFQSPYGEFISPYERSVLETPVGSLDQQDYVNIDWRIESYQVLLWSILKLDSLSAIESCEQASPEILKPEVIGPVDVSVGNASLRKPEILTKTRDLAELWHWRSRTRELIESGEEFDSDSEELRSLGIQSFDDVVRKTATAAHENGDIPSIVNGDFAVRGIAYRDLDEMQWGLVRSISMERHFALNWVCGYAKRNRWDDTPTDT